MKADAISLLVAHTEKVQFFWDKRALIQLFGRYHVEHLRALKGFTRSEEEKGIMPFLLWRYISSCENNTLFLAIEIFARNSLKFWAQNIV